MTKSPRSNSSISSASSTISTSAKRRGGRRPSPSVTTNELQKRFKEKLRDKLRGGQCVKEEELHAADIVMDSSSQKSYIQLMSPIRPDQPHPQLAEHGDNSICHQASYSRCSVIRSASDASPSHIIDHQDRYSDNNVAFFQNHHHHHHHQLHLQDKPVDFSPKNKFSASNGNTSGGANSGSANGFEMVLNYTMVA